MQKKKISGIVIETQLDMPDKPTNMTFLLTVGTYEKWHNKEGDQFITNPAIMAAIEPIKTK